MRKVNYLAISIMSLLSVKTQGQTAQTIITLDRSSPTQYQKKSSNDSTLSLGSLISGIEDEFGSLKMEEGDVSKIKDELIVFERSDILSQIARLNRKYYASLIEMGFSPEEAMKLIVANPIIELLKIKDQPSTKTRSIFREVQ